MSNEECDKVHAPTFDLFEQKNRNLTLQLAVSEDEYDTCSTAEEVYLVELDDIKKEKD